MNNDREQIIETVSKEVVECLVAKTHSTPKEKIRAVDEAIEAAQPLINMYSEEILNIINPSNTITLPILVAVLKKISLSLESKFDEGEKAEMNIFMSCMEMLCIN